MILFIVFKFYQELTGELPLDYPRQPGEGLPHIKKRVTTAFTLSDKTVNADKESAEVRFTNKQTQSA